MAVVEALKRTKARTRYINSRGEEVPGVTTILGVLAKPALIHWAWDLGRQGFDYRRYRDALADIGTLAHQMIADDLRGIKTDTSAYSPEQVDKAENAALSWYEWRRGHSIEPLVVEQPLVSEAYQYGGTPDCLALVDGTPTLLDIKTSRAIYQEMLIQLAAYWQLLQENGHDVRGARILRVGRDESEGFEERAVGDMRVYWDIFYHCLQIYSLQKRLKGVSA